MACYLHEPKEVPWPEEINLRKTREVIRLKYEAGLSNRAIASACRISNSTVGEYLKRAESAGLRWPFAAVSLLFENLARFPRNGTIIEKRSC